MAESAEHIAELIYQLLVDAHNGAPSGELLAWMEANPGNAALVNKLQNDDSFRVAFEQRSPAALQELDQALMRSIDLQLNHGNTSSILAPVAPMRKRRRWGWAAASIALIIGSALALFLHTDLLNSTAEEKMATTNHFLPGREGAILTLGDGRQVVLDSLSNGVVASQNGAEIVLQNGRIAYDLTGKAVTGEVYNTVTTPKGRQFVVILPDGTQVWLNAASSIRYPTVFAGKERRVTISGEVYFEVAQNENLPFHVDLKNGANITVLGTHFNVNAYENERNILTTLLEGSVRITTQPEVQVILIPGEQAQIEHAASGAIKVLNNVDIEKTMAWKNGLFNFNGLSFEEIMRQLERWYDIQVVYENNNVPSKRLIGKMTRDVPLEGLLKNLEELGVNCRLHDRILTIIPSGN